MTRVKMVIEYDGTAYAGWQVQKKQKTVQGEIENALHILFKQRVPIVAAGRTDAGVHARQQVAHCDLPEPPAPTLMKSLNGILKKDIVIKEMEKAAPDFHARFDARKRTYRYRIALTPTALNRHFSWEVRYGLNRTLLIKAADYIRVMTDFQTFCKLHSSNTTYDCHIAESFWQKENDLLIYTVAANRFLYGMVRALVGTMVELARGRIDWATFIAITESRDVRSLPYLAPARGLTLESVTYKN
ncbi:MAG: tRNA pseudouridine(38-40) synthase TruA [Calditrichaeota bacterium]|nr:MAG: tRNA pseudouridine(38-40) synthase TruA [Calditrichota bacterium]